MVGQQESTTETGAQAPVTDARPEPTSDAEAPETLAGASGAAQEQEPLRYVHLAGEAKPRPKHLPAPVDLVTFAFPLPWNIPPEALERAVVIVKAKSPRGRRRAGREFTREETSIPFDDLRQHEIDALTGDAELVVSLRVQKPD